MTTRTAAWLLAPVTAALLAGCAQPGELGGPPLPPPPAPAAPAPPAPPSGPVMIASGTVEDGVTVRATGPARFSVRTVVVPPGGSTGWHRHPGTEISVVTSGSVTLIRGPACEQSEYGTGDAFSVADGVPHLGRNDGAVPAEVVVTYLLEPGGPERSDAPACSTR